MKIALVREKYTDFGGAERYLANLAEHLLMSGHEVHIFAHEWNSRGITGSKGSRFHVHKVPVITGLSVLRVISFAVNVRRLLKQEQFDIIHSFERTFYQDVYRAGDGCHREWLVQRRKTERWYKTIINSINPLHWALLRIEREIFRTGNYRIIIAISKRGKEEIVRHYKVPREKIKVIYNAIDTNRFNFNDRIKTRAEVRKTIGIPEDTPLLIFVGSGFRRKGLSAAIRALARLETKVSLMVIGKDSADSYRLLAKKVGVEKRVFFIGPVVDVEKYYCASDLFIFPTVYEPFGNVCLEAMAAGLPIVTSRICGGSEVLDEGKNGYVIEDPTDCKEIAYKIQMGLKLEPECVRNFNMQKLREHSWDVYLEQLSAIYKEICKKSFDEEFQNI